MRTLRLLAVILLTLGLTACGAAKATVMPEAVGKRLLVVERGGSLMQGLVALRWDGCCEASNRTRTTSCDRAYVLAA